MDIGPHVFPTIKYRMIKDRLLQDGLCQPTDIIEPPPVNIDDIRLVHTKEYVEDMLNLRWSPRTVRSELPLTWQIIEGYFTAASGTILATRIGLEEKIGFHIGGGFHHAFPDHAEGFCYVNDIAIAIKKMKQEKRIERAAVIDCDLHQGNGTAKIFQNDETVFTFSIHEEYLYPIKEESNWDIGLNSYLGDDVYLKHLRNAVPKILDSHKPELVIYVAGADPYKDDQLGTLQISKEGLRNRDEIVIDGCRQREIPVVIVLAGGYALKIEDTVDIHLNTCKVCLGIPAVALESELQTEQSNKESRNNK